MHLHIFGAPGSGVTTLGKAVASELGIAYFDVDDVYWFTDDALPYRRKRNPEHRRQLLAERLDAAKAWVLGGSLCGWGDEFIPLFDLVVWRWLPAEVRLERIRQREILRYDAQRLQPGGDLHEVFEKFLQWAASLDVGSHSLRCRGQELQWLRRLPCEVLILEEDWPLEWLVQRIVARVS